MYVHVCTGMYVAYVCACMCIRMLYRPPPVEMSLGFVHISNDGSIGTDGDAIVHTSTGTTDGATTNIVTSTTDTTSITPTTDGGNVAGADDEEGSNTLDFTTSYGTLS